MNRVIMIARLCCDPSIKQNASGTTIASYRIAVDRPMAKGDADFFQVVAFGKSAEFCEKYLSKGQKIAIEGRLQSRSYDGKDGKKVNVVEIVAERHEFVESKQASASSSYTAPAQTAPASPYPPEADFTVLDDEADLPFD